MRWGITLLFAGILFVSMVSVDGGCFAVEAPPLHIKGGSTAAHYQMVSFPVTPYEDQDPLTNDGILIDELGQYNPYEWRFFQWDSCVWDEEKGEWEFIEQHIELNDREFEPIWGVDHNIRPGRGYWIISRKTRDIYVEGDLPSDEYILLEPGWNQMGNIYYVQTEAGIEFKPFPISNLFVSPESGGEVKQLIDPENPYTYVTLQDYVDGLYVNRGGESNLEVGKGYWLKNIDIEQRGIRLWFRTTLSESVSNEIKVTNEYLERIAQQEEPPSPPSAVESSSSVSVIGGSGGGSGGCFVATVAYGSYEHPSVQPLRRFRDQYLLTNSCGRMFVDVYYRYSPAVARFAAHREPIKILARFTLTPVIGLSHFVSKINAYSVLVIICFAFLGSLFVSKRGMGGRCKPKFPRKGRMRT
jgi:hypothetical protein